MKLPEIKIKVTLKDGDRVKIGNSNDANNILSLLFDSNTIAWQEEVILLSLNKANEVFGWYRISKGGTDITVMCPKIIFSILLNSGASAFIISHNHPSGSLTPSEMDLNITKKLKEGGKLLDINLLDHLIKTPNKESFVSLADMGLL